MCRLLAHGAASDVLIIGAGDGGVLRRVLQHNTVHRAVMVEIDGEVISLAKQFLPNIAGDAWDDKRADVIVGDGIDYVKRAPDASFDAIIVDSTDPIGVGEVLFTDSFYENCARILTPRGLVVNQCGVPFMQADELRETSARRAKFFPHVTAYVAAVPTYVGGFMTLGWAAKDASLAAVGVGEIRTARGVVRNSGGDALLDAGNPRRRVQSAALYRPEFVITRHLESYSRTTGSGTLDLLHPDRKRHCQFVIPANAGTQVAWVPASAGMTRWTHSSHGETALPRRNRATTEKARYHGETALPRRERVTNQTPAPLPPPAAGAPPTSSDPHPSTHTAPATRRPRSAPGACASNIA